MEFALIAPLLLLLLVGLLAGGWLLFQYEALADAARSGVREAIVETSLLDSTGCASGTPLPIAQAAQAGAPGVAIDQAPLCQSATNPAELVQPSPPAGQATVTVTGLPSLNPAALAEVTVTVSLPVRPLTPLPQWTLLLTASSTRAAG